MLRPQPWAEESQLLQSCCCLRWLYYGFIACLPLSRQSLRIAEDFADAVLEVAGIAGAHHSLVEYGEAELVPVGGSAVACQRDDAGKGAGLCLDVILGEGSVHTLFQSAIYSCLRQRREQMNIDILITIGIAEQTHLEFGGDIVVERQTRTVGNAVALTVESYLVYKATDILAGVTG